MLKLRKLEQLVLMSLKLQFMSLSIPLITEFDFYDILQKTRL
jgi:hypothetical protein